MTKVVRLAEILGRISCFIPAAPAVRPTGAMQLKSKSVGMLSLIDALQMASGHCSQKELVLAFDRWSQGVTVGSTGNTAPEVTELLGRLREAGLIEHLRMSNDQRSKQIRLTPAGRQYLNELHAIRGGPGLSKLAIRRNENAGFL